MKKKKIIFIGITLIFIIVTYLSFIDKKVYYLALGDSLAEGQNPNNHIGFGYSDYVKEYLEKNNLLEFYSKDFAKSGYKATDLLRDIKENKKIKINGKNITIKNALIKSDIVTLSIGANDLFYKMGITSIKNEIKDDKEIYKYLDEVIIDLDKLLKEIRIYVKENIILIGYYNPVSGISLEYGERLEPIFIYANKKFKETAKKYKIDYVDIYPIFKENPELLPNPLDIHPSSRGYEIIASNIIEVIEDKIINKY